MNSEKFYCTNIFYRNHHYSRSRGFTQPGCLNINQICDGFEDCATGVDEQYCDDYVLFRGFRIHYSILTIHCYVYVRACYATYSASLDLSVVDNASPRNSCATVDTIVLTVLMNTITVVIETQ